MKTGTFPYSQDALVWNTSSRELTFSVRFLLTPFYILYLSFSWVNITNKTYTIRLKDLKFNYSDPRTPNSMFPYLFLCLSIITPWYYNDVWLESMNSSSTFLPLYLNSLKYKEKFIPAAPYI